MHFWAPMHFWASLIFDIVMLNRTLSLTWAYNLEFVKDKRFLKEFHVLLFLMIEDFFCDNIGTLVAMTDAEVKETMK